MIAQDTLITTFTGLEFFPFAPNEAHVHIVDIAHALARQCRYGGHVSCEHYSVAEHCVLVSSLVPPDDALWGLLHDCEEAYFPDLPAPIKRAFPEYTLAGDRLRAIVLHHFGLPAAEPASGHDADRRIRVTEQQALFKNHRPLGARLAADRDCRVFEAVDFEPYVIPIVGLSPGAAERSFLTRFRALTTR